MAIPIGLLVAFTYATTGHLTNPGYDALYRIETIFYPELGYHRDWAIEDPRYLVQNLPLLLAGLPDILPPCAPGRRPRPVRPGLSDRRSARRRDGPVR